MAEGAASAAGVDGSGTLSVDQADQLAQGVPLGFTCAQQFADFADLFNFDLEATGWGGTGGVVQGSAASGVGFNTGEPFDVNRQSDLDVALTGEDLYQAAKDAGIEIRAGDFRTRPLSPQQIDALGLGPLQQSLSEFLGGRPVKFMIYSSQSAALNFRGGIVVP